MTKAPRALPMRTVSGTVGSWGAIERSNPSLVTVHALTGEILYRQSTRDARPITRAYNWVDPLHFGYFGGIWTKVLWVVLGLTSGFLFVTGFMIWILKRRPSRKPRRSAREQVPA